MTAIPELAPAARAPLPRVSRRTLVNGLTVLAIRRPSVPMVEVRLRILTPMAGAQSLARTTMLAETMLKGTTTRDAIALEQAFGLLGGELNVGADRDKLMIGGNALAADLPAYLALVNEVLTSATYPTREVDEERQRVAEHLVIAESSAGTVASKAIAAKIYGAHPYGYVVPTPEEIQAVSAAQVRALHRSRVRPEGGVLVIVGDVQPKRALDAAEVAFGDWTGSPTHQRIPRVSFEPDSAISLVDRPGSVQSAIRFALPAVGRDDSRYPIQQVANMLFGGYFSSRLVRNLREDKGYTYTPRSGIDVGREASILTIGADVATEVTAAAINEVRYELGRLATTLVDDDELENARQYLVGSSLISLSSQAGLAGTCANLEIAGLGLDWLAANLAAIATVSEQDVRDFARDYVTPDAARLAVVGDASLITADMGALGLVSLSQSSQ